VCATIASEQETAAEGHGGRSNEVVGARRKMIIEDEWLDLVLTYHDNIMFLT